jgi:hypothetical protein
MLRDSVDPRIPGVRIKHVDGIAGGPVIIVRVIKSWASPHMVKFKNSTRFFSRNSGGKYQLDVREIRAAFLASESLGDKISDFRSDRIGRILTGETPVTLQTGPKFVLHLLPIRSFAEQVSIDLKFVQQEQQLKPMGKPRTYGPFSFNFNGLYSYGGEESSKPYSYIQIFRNGAIEAVYARITLPPSKAIRGIDCEAQLLRTPGPSYIELQKRLGFGPPFFIAVSLLSVAGFALTPGGPNDWPSTYGKIDQEVLLAPEVLIEESPNDLDRASPNRAKPCGTGLGSTWV